MKDLKLTSKYIIPFSFKSLEYNRLHEKNNSWIIEKTGTIESDLFEYVQKSFITSNNIEDFDKKIACIYRYVGKKLPENFKLKYIHENYERYFYVREVHVALFQTGIGLLWFIPEISGDFSCVDEAIGLTYNLKELARNEYSNAIFKENIELLQEGAEIDSQYILPDGKHYKKLEHFFVGEWIDTIAKTISTCISYYPSRQRIIDGQKRNLPDKALLFHCAVFSDANNWNNNIIYLSRGYKSSYRINKQIDEDIYQPFENVKCYASSEGCGYYAISNNLNDSFYNDLSKVDNDYFTLFLLTLYQSYTLLRYSELVANSLSAKKEDYSVYSKDLEKKLDLLTTELNVFLAKSVYTSVSHVQHQNEFFNYITDKLMIKENVKSVLAGIEALDNIEANLYEEEMKNRNHFLEGCLTIVSLLAVLSAFNDGNDFIRNYYFTMFKPGQPFAVYTVNVILIIIALLVMGLLFKYIVYKPERKHKKR